MVALDVLIVGAVVLVAIVFLVVLFVLWTQERKQRRGKLRELEKGAKTMPESVLVE